MTPAIPYYVPQYLPVHSSLPVLPSTVSSTHETTAQTNVIPNPVQQPDKTWYPDSGTTNHFDQGARIGNGVQPYLRTCNVQMSDGS